MKKTIIVVSLLTVLGSSQFYHQEVKASVSESVIEKNLS